MLQAISTFAQDYTYYTISDSSTDAGMGGLLVAYIVLAIVLGIPSVIGLWKMFEKAKEPGWAAIVPIYNIIVYLRVVGRPMWWALFFILAFIPFLGIVVSLVLGLILANDMAKSFGKDAGYTILLFLVPFIGYPLLGFGKDKYQGPAALVSTTGSDSKATVKPASKHKA